MRLAAIDIGTNSTRLLAAEYCGRQLHPLVRELRTTRLGAGLVRSGFLSPTGKEATIGAVKAFREIAAALGAEATFLFGTSAMREAVDGADFAGLLQGETGLPVSVLPPDREAQYSYTGVVKSLPGHEDPCVFDLGGGSCELIWPTQAGNIRAVSLPVGAVYLTDQWLQHDPPLPGEVAAARVYIRNHFRSVFLPRRPLVGVGGTVTCLVAMALGMQDYDSARVHGTMLTPHTVKSQLAQLLALPARERALLPGVQQERAAILPAGALVVEEIFTLAGFPALTVSEGDILLGCLYHAISQA